MTDFVALQKRVLVDTYVNRSLALVRGEGARLFDQDGASFLDLTSGYGAAILGYGHSALCRALAGQITELHVLHCSFASDIRVQASRALLARAGGAVRRVFWSNSGAEAVEAALKLVLLAAGKRRLVACRGGYHGKTLGALSLTHGARYRSPFEPLPIEVVHVPFGDAEALAAALDERTAAVVLEPIQGESGVIVPAPGYLRAVRAACDRAGVLLVLDEVQTGTGRTGAFLACHHEGVAPDVVCLGKGLAGGVPVGATLVTESVASGILRGSHTSTFGGNPLACAGVLAVLDALTDELLAEVAEKGERFQAALRAIGSGHITEVRGRGMMIAVELGCERDRILRDLQRAGVLALPAGQTALRFLPPYVISIEELDHAVATLARVLRDHDAGRPA